jgi:hypothetical protein
MLNTKGCEPSLGQSSGSLKGLVSQTISMKSRGTRTGCDAGQSVPKNWSPSAPGVPSGCTIWLYVEGFVSASVSLIQGYLTYGMVGRVEVYTVPAPTHICPFVSIRIARRA